MECMIREWKIEDAPELAEMLNNKKILNNLRDGLLFQKVHIRLSGNAKDYIDKRLNELEKQYGVIEYRSL